MLKIVNCSKRRKYVFLAAMMGFCIFVSSEYAYAEPEWQDANGNTSPCNGAGESYSSGNFNVCQSDSGTEYRYSRWVYYNVYKENLPLRDNGTRYIPPIGPGDSDTGSSDSGNLNGWLRVNDSISDCIVENGGFWRRGYFHNKDRIYLERTDTDGKVFGVAQSGLAPIGFTGRSSNNISFSNDVGHNDSTHSIGEWRPINPETPLGEQTLYYGSRNKVWASMDASKGTIDDAKAQELFTSFGGGPLDYGDYFLSDYDGADAASATVLFCYSENEPYNGVVRIGSSSAIYAYDSKNYNNSEKNSGVTAGGTESQHNPITIDLGTVSERNYTPGYILSQVSKNDATKTGKTSYSTNLYLNNVKKYTGVNGSWSATTSDNKTEIDSGKTYSSTPSFDLAIGDNIICVDLSYKERNNSSDYISLKACAKITYDPSFTCKLNGATMSYSNPVNYGRMRIYKNSNAGTILGDSTGGTYTPSATMWLKPEDGILITYEGCIGEQIAKDGGVADWNAERTRNDQNSIMRVETTGSLLNDSHYTGTGNSIDKDSANSRNITAHEVLGSKTSEHINAKYQFGEQKTKQAQVGNVGRIINNDYKIRSDDSRNVRATMKIPYNYVLEPKAVNTTGGIVTLGGLAAFNLQIVKNGRVNKPVDMNKPYSTNVKAGTRAKYLSFRLSTDTDLSKFTNKMKNIEYLDGNNVDNLSDILKDNFSTSDIESGDISADDINNNSEKVIKLKAADASADYNKLCVAVAVWPADSHNIRTENNNIESEDQPTALDPDHYYDDAFTRISASCETIGKYPSMSVEGNGMVSAGDVKGATTNYNNRVFGSWSEYGLVANGVVSLGSGASLAYNIGHPQTQKNQMENYEYAGIGKDQFDSPQTLGNIDSAIGLQDSAEASVYIDQMKGFVDDIKSTYFAEKQECGEFLCRIGNTYVNTNYDSKVTIGDFEAAEINSHKDEDAQVFIYSQQEIVIKNEVTQLFANLITDSALDTCEEGDHKTDDARDGTLVDKCPNILVINGAVYSEGEVSLDRVFGGGSPYGSLSLDSGTLVQRAEIFNYDPKIVKWGYDYKHENQPLTTTYIEELSTRY